MNCVVSSYVFLTCRARFYQEYLGKSLTDKYTKLNLHLDKVVHNANSEISTLHSKVAGKLNYLGSSQNEL